MSQYSQENTPAEASNTGVFLWYYEIFKKAYFEKHLWTAASETAKFGCWRTFRILDTDIKACHMSLWKSKGHIDIRVSGFLVAFH